MRLIVKFCLITLCFLHFCSIAQNEHKRWYFGVKAGLNFMTTPPTIINTGAMNAHEGCSAICDGAGSLLFYTNGLTIWNQLDLPMANGTGLLGDSSTTQGTSIIKDPGNPSEYYVFTLDQLTGPDGLRYSKVDMSLSAGMGSVTVKNVMMQPQSSEKMTAVRHCNGTDFWVISHDWNSANFRVFLVNAFGVSPTPVVSSAGPSLTGAITNSGGYLKVSPNGKKLALAMGQSFQLYDFNNCTGVVCNPFTFGPGFGGYGCEFSPDGTKLYGTTLFDLALFQWNLCAGSNAAIAASQTSITSLQSLMGMQRAPDGKIYVARYGQPELGVINNPNALGAACNFVEQGQLMGPHLSQCGLPNRIEEPVADPPAPFTHSISTGSVCHAVSFQLPVNPCYGNRYAINSVKWNFGDPVSGSANTSSADNPTHLFSIGGTYTVDLILNYLCSADTLSQTVTIASGQSLSVAGSSATCSGVGSATASIKGGTGPFSYTWMPSSQNAAVATGLGPNIYTVTASDANCVMTTTVSIGLQNTLSGTVTPMNIPCPNGGSTGAASVSLSGGSGPFTYNWNSSPQNDPMVTNLAPGNYSLLVKMASGPCTFTQSFLLGVISGTPVGLPPVTACTRQHVRLTSGISGDTYLWTGPASFSVTTPEAFITNLTLSASGIYTLNVSDLNHCLVTATVPVTVYSAPMLTLSASSKSGCAPFSTALKVEISDVSPIASSAMYINNKAYGIDQLNPRFTAPGNYSVSLYVANIYSCSTAAGLDLTVYETPEAGFDYHPLNPVENQDEVFFTNTSTGKQQALWNWYFINTTGPQSREKDPSLVFKSAGIYPVAMVVTNIWGCSDTIVKPVDVMPDFVVYVPDVFTPNGDGRNDTFYAKGSGIKMITLHVFDRWGEKIFTSSDLHASWDGFYKGKECKTDSYIWKISVSGLNGQLKEMTGHVMLLR